MPIFPPLFAPPCGARGINFKGKEKSAKTYPVNPRRATARPRVGECGVALLPACPAMLNDWGIGALGHWGVGALGCTAARSPDRRPAPVFAMQSVLGGGYPHHHHHHHHHHPQPRRVAARLCRGKRGFALPPACPAMPNAIVAVTRHALPALPHAQLFVRLPDWARRCCCSTFSPRRGYPLHRPPG